jgi:hypothetical protein
MTGHFSDSLIDAITNAVTLGEQVFYFKIGGLFSFA